MLGPSVFQHTMILSQVIHTYLFTLDKTYEMSDRHRIGDRRDIGRIGRILLSRKSPVSCGSSAYAVNVLCHVNAVLNIYLHNTLFYDHDTWYP